ncbi:hypothetical protein BDP55DRAFT_679601 [Colletotrichum godetiae]|uniref:Uncharacterized protein n=1 Tax=Colletotrichum godetiae TaxID=1209918 RepID=A0AAJ0AD69_9PEZI|nr:uncharacterized protein BDP55DRAFT_679601 [Colletotrichum godetiae]KAK1659467.1 hypothetical protein BDP55DRAFT_679601 [Colletotrichum godetiae]
MRTRESLQCMAAVCHAAAAATTYLSVLLLLIDRSPGLPRLLQRPVPVRALNWAVCPRQPLSVTISLSESYAALVLD